MHRGQSFTSHVDAILREAKKRVEGLQPQTVFFGGGTPTLLPKKELSRLLDGLNKITGFRDSALEVSMEANPESFKEDVANTIREGGVNRISIGVQSLQETVLRAYDRAHGPEEALRALALARKIFPRFNADLIFGFPGQNPDSFFHDLKSILSFQPDHLSCYELTYEPGTPLTQKKNRGKWTAENPDLCEELFLETALICKSAGLLRYEISNYARPGRACLHNLAAWRSLPYIGLGAGAASWSKGVRRQNLLRPEEYEKAIFGDKDPIGFRETPNAETILFDLLMMGLRLTSEGVSLERIKKISGMNPLKEHPDILKKFQRNGWLSISSTTLKVTAKGMLLLDSLLEELMPKTSV